MEYVGSLLSGTGDLVTADSDKAEVLHYLLVLVFINKISQDFVLRDAVQGGKGEWKRTESGIF